MFGRVGNDSVSIQKLKSCRYLFPKVWNWLFTSQLVDQMGEHKSSFVGRNSIVLDKRQIRYSLTDLTILKDLSVFLCKHKSLQ